MDKNYLVTKSNYFIMNSSYDLSLEEQKIILTLASMVQPTDEEFKKYKFKISDFVELMGLKTQTKYTEVPKITKELMKKVFEIQEGRKIIQISWLSSAIYEKGTGVVELEFSPRLKPYMLSLKEKFTQYQLINILSMKSKYSPRIYEILKCNVFKRQGYLIIDVVELKKLLKIESSYNKYNDFKRKILLQTQKELRNISDIEFEFEEIKTGRKVTSLKFYIKENVKNKKDNNFIEIENKKEEIKDKKEKNIVENEEEIKIDEFEDKNIKYLYELFEEKISKKNIEKILVNAENDIEKVERIYNYSKKQNIENLVGFMIKMVKGDNFIEPVEDKKELVFNDFPQRNYDYDKLENQLLGYHQDIEDYNQDENIQIDYNSKNNDNELEINDIDHEEEKEEIIYRSEIDTVKMFLEEQLKGIFGEVKYKTWLKYGVDNLDIDDKNIVHFCCTNSFALNMFERDYKDVLLELISSIEPLLKLNTIVK